MSKRCPPSADERPAKRQHVTRRLDQLCDNSLLHVLSFVDLVSTVRLTRCTSRVLRERFDPEAVVDTADECRAIWQPILLDVTGRGESAGFASPLAAIDYHMRLLQMAVTPGAIERRHYSVMPLSGSWKYSGINFPHGATLDDIEIMYPFDLLSPGIGREYVLIDPKTHRVNVGEDILEHAVCLEESLQKRKAASSDYEGPKTLESTVRQYIEPTIKQTLLKSHRHSPQNEVIDNEWDNYFGENSAFRENRIPSQSIKTGTSMITVQDENIIFLRMVFPHTMRGNAGGVVCMETLVYSPSSAAGFDLTHTCHMAGLCVGLDARPPKKELFAFFDATDDNPNQDSQVFQFPLIETDQHGKVSSFYPRHTAVFTAQNPVGAVLAMDELLYIGTSFSLVEVWDIASSIRLRLVTCAINGPPINARFSSMYPLSFADSSLGFVTEQKDEARGTVFSFWLPDAAHHGFNVAASLTYSDCFPVVRCTDGRVLILAYDEVGNLYLDVYLIRIHKHADNLIEALDAQSTPFNARLNQPTGGHKNPLFFAQRIDLRQRIFVQKLEGSSAYTSEFLNFSVNRRFVAVNLHRGLGAGNPFSTSGIGNAMSGPGILLLDLDKDGFNTDEE